MCLDPERLKYWEFRRSSIASRVTRSTVERCLHVMVVVLEEGIYGCEGEGRVSKHNYPHL